MQAFSVKGGRPLFGTVNISGAKNAVLPILFAGLLCEGRCRIGNVPALRDISSTLAVLAGFGVECRQQGSVVEVAAPTTLATYQAPYALVRTMRASILALAPLLARYGQAVVSLPGGCAIGERPVDIHVDGLRQMGAQINIENGYIVARCHRLHGANIQLPLPTVTGTENMLMAATLAEGETVLRHAAREPEVVDLANFLRTAGAQIDGAGSDTIIIRGVQRLYGVNYTVMPDRIEAGTYLAAVAATGGEVMLAGACAADLTSVLNAFGAGGVHWQETATGVSVRMEGRFRATNIKTAPYPGFPTDMQAQFIAVCCNAEGCSTVSETVFENRFMHVQELRRMRANIVLDGNTAHITGMTALSAAQLMATDLRASASLVIAALAAKGISRISRIYHLDRGYEQMESKLNAVGATVRRVTDSR